MIGSAFRTWYWLGVDRPLQRAMNPSPNHRIVKRVFAEGVFSGARSDGLQQLYRINGKQIEVAVTEIIASRALEG